MPTTDPRVDAYIDRAAEFAQPILRHLRAVVHAACPEVEETFKWSFPVFMHHGMLCSMAAFKQHASFGFWKASLILGQDAGKTKEAMGQFGRLASVKDLPSKRVLAGYIKEAMKLNEDGVQPVRSRTPKPPPRVPADLAAALKQHPRAAAAFKKFPPSHQREYIEWITEAKTDATRQKRLAQTIEWAADGKPRNWKYLDC
jgi:uncharacterized protein YdeI (YjbR/CyaY-like superfamily)